MTLKQRFSVSPTSDLGSNYEMSPPPTRLGVNKDLSMSSIDELPLKPPKKTKPPGEISQVNNWGADELFFKMEDFNLIDINK